MSDDLRARIMAAIAKADQDWCSDNPLYEDMADAVIAELELTDTVRLLRAAQTWIADAISQDEAGEPWLMARTLLSQLVSRVDAMGGWPQ
jgi:hypothetical protein